MYTQPSLAYSVISAVFSLAGIFMHRRVRHLASCLILICYGSVSVCLANEGDPSYEPNSDCLYQLCLQDADADDEGFSPEPGKIAVPAAKDALPRNGIGFINDSAIRIQAERQVNKLIKSNRATQLKKLATQLSRKSCNLELLPQSKKRVLSQQLYTNQRDAVVVILISRIHNDHWHVNFAATGFLINASGAVVTNRHVIKPSNEYLFAMTTDGKVHPVQDILASNEENDAVICQLKGSGFAAVPLRAEVAVGAPVRVISHPKGRLYSLTSGIVSRRHLRVRPPEKKPKSERDNSSKPSDVRQRDRAKSTKWITITAPFGKGSSGGPVFDAFGNVVAVATLTSNITVERDDDEISQFVFHDCVPAEVVLDMIDPVEKPPLAQQYPPN